ncbi:MAG: hypothetical protein ABIQ16_24845 [Polyangiaceae bacterium]
MDDRSERHRLFEPLEDGLPSSQRYSLGTTKRRRLRDHGSVRGMPLCLPLSAETIQSSGVGVAQGKSL